MISRKTPVRIFCAGSLLALCSCFRPEEDKPSGTEIKVLIAYSSSDTGRFDDYREKINGLFAETQAVFANSNTGVRLQIAAIREVPFLPEERLLDLARLVKRKDGYLDTLHRMRDEAEADLVVLVSPLENATVNASILATAETAFVIVAWDDFGAPVYGLAHEMGHLFGAMHDGTTGVVAEQFPQGFPFANDSLRTVIAYGAGEATPYFSGPENRYHGVALGEAGKTDISSVIRVTAPYISNFRGGITPTGFVPRGTMATLDYSE